MRKCVAPKAEYLEYLTKLLLNVYVRQLGTIFKATPNIQNIDEDSILRLSLLISQIVKPENENTLSSIPDQNLAIISEEFKSYGLTGYLHYTTRETFDFNGLEPTDILKNGVLGSQKYNLSGRSVEKIRSSIRKLINNGIFISLSEHLQIKHNCNSLSIAFTSPHKTKQNGRPSAKNVQVTVLAIQDLLYEIYFLCFHRKEKHINRTLLKDKISHVVEEWTTLANISYGTSETSYKTHLKKLKAICQKRVSITLGTSHITKEIENCLLDPVLLKTIFGRMPFNSTPMITISQLRERIKKNVQKNGIYGVGTYDWYSVIPYDEKCQKWKYREQLDYALDVAEKTYQEYIDCGFSKNEAETQAKRITRKTLLF